MPMFQDSADLLETLTLLPTLSKYQTEFKTALLLVAFRVDVGCRLKESVHCTHNARIIKTVLFLIGSKKYALLCHKKEKRTTFSRLVTT